MHIFFNAKCVNAEELATYSHLEEIMLGELEDDSSNTDEDSRDDDFVYYQFDFSWLGLNLGICFRFQ